MLRSFDFEKFDFFPCVGEDLTLINLTFFLLSGNFDFEKFELFPVVEDFDFEKFDFFPCGGEFSL